MSYKQLTREQRYQIKALLKTGQSKPEIAAVVGVDRSTIYRELKRNRGQRGYRPRQAHRKALTRRKGKAKRRITPQDWQRVEEKLGADWSPEQISGRLKETGLAISAEWIYLHVYADKRAGGDLWKHLRQQKKRRKRVSGRDRRGKIPNRVGIEERPEIVEQRKRLGDWEGDTIIGKGHRGAVLTLVERKSGYLLLGRLPQRTAERVAQQATRLLGSVPHQETLTLDNGKEFAKHEQIATQTGIEIYFARPYASWERGSNENTNGLIRQYLPKERRLDDLEDQELQTIMTALNHRPRKRLDFRTPHEVFYDKHSVALTS
jgi:IS30 family transposase